MRAVGEALGIGRTFPEALLKALEGVESGDQLPEIPGLHPYFAAELDSIRVAEAELADDRRRARGEALRPSRRTHRAGARPRRRTRCARARPLPAGSPSTPAPASSRRGRPTTTSRTSSATTSPPTGGAIVVLGSGTNRIGQGIEFDYCCVRAAQAFRALGHEVVLVNSNPETVSTDYDTCDRLYLEPVTLERVLDVVALERPRGRRRLARGQTPLPRRGAGGGGVPLLGDPLPAIEAAEDRARFAALLARLGLRAPAWGYAETTVDARALAGELGYPVLTRPPMCSAAAACASPRTETSSSSPARRSSTAFSRVRSSSTSTSSATATTAGSPRSSSTSSAQASTPAIPPASFPRRRSAPLSRRRSASSHARSPRGLGARGLLNLQLALHEGDLYVLEANPRASRTVPFVAKATGLPLVDHACRLLLGERLADLDLPERAVPDRAWAKEAIFPSERFAGAADRGVEMRSTGEVMASGPTPSAAYRRALRAAGRARAIGLKPQPLVRR